MTWIRLDDTFPRHPKVMGLSLEAKWAFIEALCYAGQYNTDGAVPSGVVPHEDAAELIRVGLVEETASGFLIHDFLEYNRSREDVEQERTQRQAAGRAGGRASAAARAAAGAAPDAKANSQQSSTTARPVYDPDLDPVYDPEVQKRSFVKLRFDEFWNAWPRKAGKRAAAAAFDRALRRADASEIVVGAQRYRDDPNREDAYTAHAATWLNRDGWEDDPLPARSPPDTRSKAGRRTEQLRQLAGRAREEAERGGARSDRAAGTTAGELPGH